MSTIRLIPKLQEPLQHWQTSWNYGNALGQLNLLTNIDGGLLAQPQGNATFTVINVPGALPLTPSGGSSTIGILGNVSGESPIIGNASTIDDVNVNGQQCSLSHPAATGTSGATPQVWFQIFDTIIIGVPGSPLCAGMVDSEALCMMLLTRPGRE